jgi:hypothetical protein
MVWEERYLAEPNDVLSIRIVCTKCGGSTSIPFGEKDYVPEACSYCHQQWFGRGSIDLNKVNRFIDGIRGLRERGDDAGCRICMELPGHLNMPKAK